jgi:hypothetical protein
VSTIRPGDIILVPTKALIYREKPSLFERLEQIIRVVSNVAITVFVLDSLTQ